MKKLSREAEREIDGLVRRAAAKAGYRESAELTYQEHLQRKLEKAREKLDATIQKAKHKLGVSRRDGDFAEEIKGYLTDGVAELMAQGKTEEEALRLTAAKFDEAEMEETFGDFAQVFDGFGREEFRMDRHDSYAVIGLFYAGFCTLGLTVGALIGFFAGGGVDAFLDGGWISAVIGLASGALIGTGLAHIAHGIAALRRK